MTTLFLACAGLGASILLVQIVLGLFGIEHGADSLGGSAHLGGSDMGEGLALLSVRSLSAGVAFFGLGGLAAMAVGIPGLLAVVVALVPGVAALLGTAVLMRQILRLESSGSLSLERAVGEPATVYLNIPGAEQGAGKVHLALQGRTVELQAVTPGAKPIARGQPVVVVAVVDSDTVEVVPTSIVEEGFDEN